MNFKVRVAEVSWLTEEVVSVWVEAPDVTGKTKPGQFFGVKVNKRGDLLLRRPLSVADVRGDFLRFIFKVVGKGTVELSRTKPGDGWDVLGPLGKPAPIFKGRDVVVCGGGVGAAPLLFLTRVLKEKNRVNVILGAKTASELILVNDFRRLKVKVILATDDGSAGEKGFVTQPAMRAIKTLLKPVVFACGPRSMLKFLMENVDQVPVWGFLEERMGCGVGICYCCAVERREGGYLRLCKDGPVVLLNEVRL
ncbi:MAG: dihydroorotate dehydrogenase electron transfer subunit [candidate division WOR-3 bacterium]